MIFGNNLRELSCLLLGKGWKTFWRGNKFFYIALLGYQIILPIYDRVSTAMNTFLP